MTQWDNKDLCRTLIYFQDPLWSPTRKIVDIKKSKVIELEHYPIGCKITNNQKESKRVFTPKGFPVGFIPKVDKTSLKYRKSLKNKWFRALPWYIRQGITRKSPSKPSKPSRNLFVEDIFEEREIVDL